MSGLPWLARLSCRHQADLPAEPEPGTLVACNWPPCAGQGAQREVASVVRLLPGDEDRLMRGEAVPGARGACTREGCAHGSLYHRDMESHSRSTYRGQRCYQPGCRCDGWTNEAGQVMPPLPAMQEALW